MGFPVAFPSEEPAVVEHALALPVEQQQEAEYHASDMGEVGYAVGKGATLGVLAKALSLLASGSVKL